MRLLRGRKRVAVVVEIFRIARGILYRTPLPRISDGIKDSKEFLPGYTLVKFNDKFRSVSLEGRKHTLQSLNFHALNIDLDAINPGRASRASLRDTRPQPIEIGNEEWFSPARTNFCGVDHATYFRQFQGGDVLAGT